MNHRVKKEPVINPVATTMPLTAVVPVEVKSICSSNLQASQTQGMSSSSGDKAEAERRNCMIYTLLTDNSAEGYARLDHFARLAREALTQQGVLPVDPDGEYDDDQAEVDDVLALLAAPLDHAARASPTLKRAFVLIALYIFARVLRMLLPAQGRRRRHVPRQPRQPAARHGHREDRLRVPVLVVLSGNYTTPVFVAEFLKVWQSHEPWRGHQNWRAHHPEAPSVEVKALAGIPLTPLQPHCRPPRACTSPRAPHASRSPRRPRPQPPPPRSASPSPRPRNPCTSKKIRRVLEGLRPLNPPRRAAPAWSSCDAVMEEKQKKQKK